MGSTRAAYSATQPLVRLRDSCSTNRSSRARSRPCSSAWTRRKPWAVIPMGNAASGAGSTGNEEGVPGLHPS